MVYFISNAQHSVAVPLNSPSALPLPLQFNSFCVVQYNMIDGNHAVAEENIRAVKQIKPL